MSRCSLLALTVFLLAGCSQDGSDVTSAIPEGGTPDELAQITLPDGFRIDVYASGVVNARSMTLSENGTLFVGTRRDGRVWAVRDEDGDFQADEVFEIDADLQMPNGVAMHDGSLYVAEVSRILRYDDIENRLENPPDPVVVVDNLPTETHHGWKYIAFGPDDMLYVPVGAPCNICNEPEPFATILRMNPDGSGREVVARGVRNTVGFTWHPESGELWFTDNGRDHLGDNLPPCELNRLTEVGQHFGYPHFHGDALADPEFGEGHQPSDFIAPVQNLGPHVAPLGMEFYTGTQFPEAYGGRAYIAEHGSWNRSEKIGYRVTMVTLDERGEATAYEPFAEGWLQGEDNWGRPVDLEHLPDGSLLVSDDQRGRIYRISYTG
ncbi:MAG: sorbosone dehydrogenase family protein [Rhodothermales bacterium]|nr:sorbosone dehydrogenase family protein [Rhodothermales bacterium]MBO6779145.1 sorbosone dehydrogenase family protein [Rhodothermales bacterium]